jgi:type II secretory pathway pseudopilin PulG
MKSQHMKFFRKKLKSEAGMTLVETVVALAMLLVVTVGVMNVAAIAVSTTENQGHLAARTAEYAQDKMEQLLALRFCDGTSDTTVIPTVPAGGQGLAGCVGATTTPQAGGGLNTAAPVAGYVDYLDANGNLVAAAGNWQYIRVWQISVPAGTNNLKQIDVSTQVRSAVGGSQTLLQSSVSTLKANPL